jgi:hypothetical protein
MSIDRKASANTTSTSSIVPTTSANTAPSGPSGYQFVLGDPAPESERFCPWLVVKKYPFSYMGAKNQKEVSLHVLPTASLFLILFSQVAEDYFDQGKIFERPWDL